jgi:hypothetical protein
LVDRTQIRLTEEPTDGRYDLTPIARAGLRASGADVCREPGWETETGPLHAPDSSPLSADSTVTGPADVTTIGTMPPGRIAAASGAATCPRNVHRQPTASATHSYPAAG